MKKAFTMIELVFVIVVLGILAAIAIPRLAPIMENATTAKGKSDVAAIRAAIVGERQGRLLMGQTTYVDVLDDVTTYNANQEIFDGNSSVKLLSAPIITGSSDGKWMKTNTNTYQYRSGDAVAEFTYTQTGGKFDCNESTGDSENDALCAYMRK